MLLFGVVFGIFAFHIFDADYDAVKNYCAKNNRHDITGKVYKKEYKNERYRLYLKGISVDEKGDTPYCALIFMEDNLVKIGSIVKVSGNTLPISIPANEGEFDYYRYLKSKRICVSLSACSLTIIKEPKVPVKDFLYRLKNAMILFYDDYLPGEESGILASICLGDKSELSEEANEMFAKAGLSHILAISGLHLSVVGAGIYRLLRKFRMGFVSAGVLSLMVVFVYGLLCENPISMVRATVMFALYIGAEITGRSPDTLNSLAIASIILIAKNPFVILDSGFVMSFTAILGIVLCANPMVAQYEKYCEDMEKKPVILFKMLLFGFSLQMFTYPVVVYYFNRIPIYNVFLNILILPVLAVLLFFGLVFGVLFIPQGLIPCHYILYYYEACADFVNDLPGASLYIATPKLWMVFIYYFVLMCAVHRNFIKNFYIKTAGLSILCVVLVGFLCSSRPDGFRIDMLSVGQGEGIFVQSKEKVTFFLDGGSTSKKNLGKYTLLPYLKAMGVGDIDYWLLTHLDSDHINGCIELLESGYNVKRLCLAKGIVKTEDFSYIERLCAVRGTEIIYLEVDDTIKTKSMEIKIMYPNYPADSKDANENSLAFLLRYKDFDAVFTGDMGVESEKRLLSSYDFNEDIELLKIGHHGSKNSNCKEWIDAINPDVAIISAGEGNRYGHPSKETLERLDDAGIEYYCTIDCGRIRVTYEDGKVKVNSFL